MCLCLVLLGGVREPIYDLERVKPAGAAGSDTYVHHLHTILTGVVLPGLTGLTGSLWHTSMFHEMSSNCKVKTCYNLRYDMSTLKFARATGFDTHERPSWASVRMRASRSRWSENRHHRVCLPEFRHSYRVPPRLRRLPSIPDRCRANAASPRGDYLRGSIALIDRFKDFSIVQAPRWLPNLRPHCTRRSMARIALTVDAWCGAL